MSLKAAPQNRKYLEGEWRNKGSAKRKHPRSPLGRHEAVEMEQNCPNKN